MSRLRNARTSHLQRHVVPAAIQLLLDRATQLTNTFQPLSDVCHIEMGQSPVGSACNTNGDGFGLIGGPADLGLIYPEPKKWTTQPTKICKAGDIIICVRATIGEPRWSDGEYCLGRGVAGIRPLSKDLHPSFVFRLLQAREEELRAHGTGTTFKTISKIHLERLQLPIPTPKHQELIANFLDWLDNGDPNSISMDDAPELPHEYTEQRRIVDRIEAIARRVEEARGLRQKAVEEAEAIIGIASAHLFENIATQTRVVTIGETFTFRNDLIRPTDGKTGDIRFIGLQHIESHSGKRIGEDWLRAEDLTGRKFKFSPGEIVYGYLRPYLNKVWIADCDGFCSVDQYVLKPKSEAIEARYLAHFMRSVAFLRQAIAMTHNLLLPRLRTALLESIPIPLPSLPEQHRIVAYLDGLQAKVDELKRLQAESQKELDALMPSVLAKAFAGELT